MILDAPGYTALTGITYAGADATALAGWLSCIDAALKRMLLPYLPEQTTVTQDVLDAPPRRDLLLRYRPVQSITSLWFSEQADGVIAAFDLVNDLFVSGTQYQLHIDDPINGVSRSGIVRRLDRDVWSSRRWGAPGTLSRQIAGCRGAVLCTYVAGDVTVNADIQAAACLVASKAMNSRKFGAQPGSASLNGASYSLPGQQLAEGMLRAPDVIGYLRAYMTPKFG